MRLIEPPRLRVATEGDAGIAVVSARAAAGEEAAWVELVGAYGRRVFALALARLGDREDAEDVAQSVFATVAEKLGSGAYREEGRFEAWLFRIANNRVRDEARRRKRTLTARLGAEPGVETEGGSDDDERAALRAAVAGLSEAEREVLSLRHQGGMSFSGIAAVCGEPLGTILARHHRAVAKLRAELDDNGSGG